MKINESQLRKIIKESVKKVLKEGQQRTPIFTLNAIDLTTDEGIDDMQYTTKTYYSEDEAIEAAKEMANKYSDWDGVINIFIMAGEYELPSGDVYGEPDAIYTVSNKDEETTRSAREKSGYTRHDVDGYPNLNESQLRKIIKESIKKVLKESTNNPIILGDESDGYLWYVEIGYGDYTSTKFNIYARNPQEALDSAVDYCEQQGWDGLFYDNDEDVIEYENDFITAGNSGHYLRLDSFIVRRM
jgi:hypothetical protein